MKIIVDKEVIKPFGKLPTTIQRKKNIKKHYYKNPVQEQLLSFLNVATRLTSVAEPNNFWSVSGFSYVPEFGSGFNSTVPS